jgi:hypothetical protein
MRQSLLRGRYTEKKDKGMYVHWMTGCLPWHLYSEVSRNFLSGKTSEQSAKKVTEPWLRDQVSIEVAKHSRKAKRKGRNDSCFWDQGE